MTKYIAWLVHLLAVIRITSVRERKNMKTQMNTNIETLEYLDNKGVTETLYEETAQVQEIFYCTTFASIFSLNI